MDRRERYDNDEELLRVYLRAMQARLWTAIPGIVTQYPGAAGAMTVNVQPTVINRVRNPDGSFAEVPMPVLLDCPVLWQGGGGVTATFPIAAGDECLVVFSSRCIDGWWHQGGVQTAPEVRMHSLSDGFALIGVRSLPNTFTPPASAAALISNDGQTYITLNPTSKAVAVHAPGGINLNGVTIDSNGNLTSPATITGTTDVVGGGKHLKTHTHSGVTPGAGTSGPPS